MTKSDNMVSSEDTDNTCQNNVCVREERERVRAMEQILGVRACVSLHKGSLSRQRQSDIIASKDFSVFFGGAGLEAKAIFSI